MKAALMNLVPKRGQRGAAGVPVVRLSGVIGAVTPLRPGMSLAGVARTLERAFATRHAKAVALVINSPGGSPVQSRQIYLRIRQLADALINEMRLHGRPAGRIDHQRHRFRSPECEGAIEYARDTGERQAGLERGRYADHAAETHDRNHRATAEATWSAAPAPT